MKVLRAAVVLGLSTPLVVLSCGSDDGTSAPDGAAGDGASGGDGAAGASTGGSISGGAGAPAVGGDAANGGAMPSEGGAGAADTGGAAGQTSAGAGGAPVEPEPECGDEVVEGGLLCFAAPVPHTLVEGTPTDLAIGDWDAAEGLDVIVANTTGLSYFSNDAAGGFMMDTYVGTTGAVLGSGQLDSGAELDLLLGQANSGSSIIGFGDGAGAVTSTESSFFNSEGVLFNYFVADVAGSGASQDIVVTFANSISVVLTTGTEGEGFSGPITSTYPPAPQDGVIAKLGSAQWLVYSSETNIGRQLITYDAGSVTLGVDQLTTPAGGSTGQLDVGDFNEDGFDDVAATLTDSGNVSVLFGDGVSAGDFATVVDSDRFLTLTIGEADEDKTQRDVKSGDFNGDGHTDVAVSLFGRDAVAIFSGDGAGAFRGPELVSTGADSAPTRLAVGDLNDDGVDDLAVVGLGSSQIIILLSDP